MSSDSDDKEQDTNTIQRRPLPLELLGKWRHLSPVDEQKITYYFNTNTFTLVGTPDLLLEGKASLIAQKDRDYHVELTYLETAPFDFWVQFSLDKESLLKIDSGQSFQCVRHGPAVKKKNP